MSQTSNRLRKRAYHLLTKPPSTLQVGLWALKHPLQAHHIRHLIENPIVIGGCGRSGTTLLLSMLSCHPQIAAVAGESNAFCPDAYSANPDLTLPFRLDWLWRRLMESPPPAGALRLCEKTPRNVLVFDRILHHYGDRVRIIHIVRDGRAVVTSRHPSDPTAYHVSPRRWTEETLCGIAAERDARVVRVRYEDLVTDHVAAMRRLCDFLQLPFVDSFLRYPETARVTEHSAWSAGARSVSSSSLATWRQPQHEGAVRALLDYPGASALLRTLGYD